jgi:HlyD family secretion protein
MSQKAKTKRQSRPMWWLWLLVPILGLGGFLLWQRLRPSESTASALIVPETVQPSRGLFRLSVTGPGTLEAAQSFDVRASGNTAVTMLPKIGQRVTKGQLLARLDSSNGQRNLQNAQLSLQKSQLNLATTVANQKNNRSSNAQQVSNAQTQVNNARLDLQNAETVAKNAVNLFAVGGNSALDVQTAKNNLTKAQSSLESAELALSTAQSSRSVKVESDEIDLKNQQLALAQAQIALKTSQSDLAASKVYAPITGVVSAVPAQVGAAASGALFTLLDDSSVHLPVQIDETEIKKVRVGQRTLVTLDALDGQEFQGEVIRVSPAAQVVQNIAVFTVVVSLPNPDGVLRPGMSAEAEIIAEEINNAITIPKRAVQVVRNRSYVELKLDKPNSEGKSSELTRVKTGPDDGSNIVITDGLTPRQTVVLPTRGASASSQNASATPSGGP